MHLTGRLHGDTDLISIIIIAVIVLTAVGLILTGGGFNNLIDGCNDLFHDLFLVCGVTVMVRLPLDAKRLKSVKAFTLIGRSYCPELVGECHDESTIGRALAL